MFNHVENPKEILEWLSQRNHHIPYDDLAYLLGTNTESEPSPIFDVLDEGNNLLSEFNMD